MTVITCGNKKISARSLDYHACHRACTYTLCMDGDLDTTLGCFTSQFDKGSECYGFSTNVPKIVQGIGLEY